MSRSPTPKQVRYHFKRISNLHLKLGDAMNKAHNAGVIEYPDGTYNENAPCKTHWETWRRFEIATQKKCAEALRNEVMNGK